MLMLIIAFHGWREAEAGLRMPLKRQFRAKSLIT